MSRHPINGIVVKFGKEKFAKDVGRLADHIMTSSILKLKTNIDAFNANNIQNFIDELQAAGDKDMFTIEEVASLLMEASSILPRATATTPNQRDRHFPRASSTGRKSGSSTRQ